MPAGKKKTVPLLPKGVFELVDVEDLEIDRKNPRLVEFGIESDTSEEEVVEVLWNEMDVEEVAMSIMASGFWAHEPLLVVEESGRLCVIEGNRRLAAAKILTDARFRKKIHSLSIPLLSKAQRTNLRLEALPVIRVQSRKDAWPFIGFKHVNGPQKWRSYPKAEYIAFVKKSTGVSLANIASQIGDKHGTVQDLYRALKVIEQAEAAGVYKREHVKGRFAFSHLTTALEYPNFARFLGVKAASEESDAPVDRQKIKELGELCRWLWGDKRDDTDRIIVSQNPNLRELEQVIGNKSAIATLRSGHGLTVAFEESKGDDTVFGDSLLDAKTALVKAQGRVSSGYNGDSSLLSLARTVAQMATDLVSVMEARNTTSSKNSGRKK